MKQSVKYNRIIQSLFLPQTWGRFYISKMEKELESKLAKLKEYSIKKEIKRLNKRIYDLDLNDKYLSSLSQDKLNYIHVKLHNALSYNKPFAEISKIKEVHDRLVKFIKNHSIIDKLDD